MHIAHLLLTKRFAGTERHVLELTAAQAAMGHRVTLILRRKAAQARADAIAHRVDPRVEVRLAYDLVDRWPVIAHARALVRRLRPDIAHAHLGSAARALRGVRGIPRLATLHIDYVPEQHAHLDGLVAIAPWQLPGIPPPLRARSVQIDNWVLPREANPGARERIRAAIGIGADEYLFGALGRMETSKGMDVLLEGFARAGVPGARLAIVGGGRELDALRARAGTGVALPGFVEAPEDWLAAFDCFVSPSREEPFGLVMLEAMQARLPVIATATGGARHLSGLIGTPLVAPGDVEAMADALRQAGTARAPRRDYPLESMRIDHKVRGLDAFCRRFAAG